MKIVDSTYTTESLVFIITRNCNKADEFVSTVFQRPWFMKSVIAWSENEFCELVPGQNDPIHVLFCGEAGIHLSGFANSQKNKHSKKL